MHVFLVTSINVFVFWKSFSCSFFLSTSRCPHYRLKYIRISSVSLYSVFAHLTDSHKWSVALISASFHHEPHGCLCTECCIGGELMAASQMNHFIASICAEHEAGQTESTVFGVFGMTWQGIKPGLPAVMVYAQPTVRFSWYTILLELNIFLICCTCIVRISLSLICSSDRQWHCSVCSFVSARVAPQPDSWGTNTRPHTSKVDPCCLIAGGGWLGGWCLQTCFACATSEYYVLVWILCTWCIYIVHDVTCFMVQIKKMLWVLSTPWQWLVVEIDNFKILSV